jgi:dihydroorotate dehydrogenase electron transfer subunit
MYKARVLENRELSFSIYSLVLSAEDFLLANFLPGQFVKIKVSSGYDPLLPRPFTVHAIHDSAFEILYQVVGRGTKAMTRLKPGDEVEFFGPLGKPFPRIEGSYLACAGGVGVAGFGYLCQGLKSGFSLPTKLLYGARTSAQLVKLDFFSALLPVEVATDDGSLGLKGTVIDLLLAELNKQSYQAILACGPKPMLKAIAELGRTYGVKTFLVLETLLACGTGYCLGCAVPSRQERYFKLCVDGPTFDAEEIDLDFLR